MTLEKVFIKQHEKTIQDARVRLVNRIIAMINNSISIGCFNIAKDRIEELESVGLEHPDLEGLKEKVIDHYREMD